jgi:hypothetical protein
MYPVPSPHLVHDPYRHPQLPIPPLSCISPLSTLSTPSAACRPGRFGDEHYQDSTWVVVPLVVTVIAKTSPTLSHGITVVFPPKVCLLLLYR